MRRMWPDEFKSILNNAEFVVLDVPEIDDISKGPVEVTRRQALKVRMTQAEYERIWPLAETRYRTSGQFAGKAVTLIANNPHYQTWHPVDGGTEEDASDSGKPFHTKYVIAHFLLEDVGERVEA